MKEKPTPSIVVCYYDTKEQETRKPHELAQRCCGEIIARCEQLVLATQHLASAARQSDVTDATRGCEQHYEVAITRMYVIRERIWDVLAALCDVKRKNIGDERFRKAVFDRLEKNHPELKRLFDHLLREIDVPLEYRNVATHQTLLFLGITLGDDFRDTYEIDSVLSWRDPDSPEGKQIQAKVRKALKTFAAREGHRFRQIADQVFEVVRVCSAAVRKKSW
jgi:hypothetical protein